MTDSTNNKLRPKPHFRVNYPELLGRLSDKITNQDTQSVAIHLIADPTLNQYFNYFQQEESRIVSESSAAIPQLVFLTHVLQAFQEAQVRPDTDMLARMRVCVDQVSHAYDLNMTVQSLQTAFDVQLNLLCYRYQIDEGKIKQRAHQLSQINDS